MWDHTVELVQSIENCCLYLGTSSMVFIQAFDGGPEVAVWLSGLTIRKSCMQYRGEQRHSEILCQLYIQLSNPNLQRVISVFAYLSPGTWWEEDSGNVVWTWKLSWYKLSQRVSVEGGKSQWRLWSLWQSTVMFHLLRESKFFKISKPVSSSVRREGNTYIRDYCEY